MTACQRRLLSIVAATWLALGLSACAATEAPGTDPAPVELPDSDSGGASGQPDSGGEAPAPERPSMDGYPAPDPSDYPSMNTDRPEGAEQTARYFWDLFAWASFAGETSELEALASDECVDCHNLIVQAKGNHNEEVLARPMVASPQGLNTEADVLGYPLAVDYSFTLRITYADGSEALRAFHTSSGMSWNGDRWIIGQLGYVSEDR